MLTRSPNFSPPASSKVPPKQPDENMLDGTPISRTHPNLGLLNLANLVNHQNPRSRNGEQHPQRFQGQQNSHQNKDLTPNYNEAKFSLAPTQRFSLSAVGMEPVIGAACPQIPGDQASSLKLKDRLMELYSLCLSFSSPSAQHSSCDSGPSEGTQSFPQNQPVQAAPQNATSNVQPENKIDNSAVSKEPKKARRVQVQIACGKI